ncbi:hypothetical protein D9611_005880 [Ephemerocybe angulata]|uniref:2OGFeDO JBP1/TET oxygenase domain-containing protein n=1 Tax=Ephemerocybe angulata TaxID=980116 RepID=A0A8H5CFS7_9AGAR|nr:hypothetical protein D9611_005880 [Tulosesus angulatus]
MPAPVPPTLPGGLDRCRLYAEYAGGLMAELTGKGPRVDGGSAPSIPLEIKSELESMARRVHETWQTRVRLPYSLDDVRAALEKTGLGETRNEHLRKSFGSSFGRMEDGGYGLVDSPAVYIDRDDNVIAWYLPGVFTRRRSEIIYEAMLQSVNIPGLFRKPRPRDNWRDHCEHFAVPERCEILPTNTDISICWYNRGFGPHNSLPAPSANLKHSNSGGLLFLERLEDTNALMGALLFLVHPDLYNQQMAVLLELKGGHAKTGDRELMKRAFTVWSTPFTGFSVIANRETVFHRDNKGGQVLFDLVASFGRYRHGRFEVPLLGARFAYDPGTAFVLPGYLLEHGASKTDGERICIASFFKPAVGYGALPNQYKEVPPPTLDHLRTIHGLSTPRSMDGEGIWN